MLYHTSPDVIPSVRKGLFGLAVCFSSSPYFMCRNPDSAWVYRLDTDGLTWIDAGHIFYDDAWEKAMPVVGAIMARLGVDENEARDLLDQTTDLLSVTNGMTGFTDADMENDFWLQWQRYEAAVLMGYDGVEQRDEQGAMWMFSVEKIVSQTPVRYAEWVPYE